MKMLINATRAEQLRVAVVEGTTLNEYQVQIDESGLTRGNIYRGVVANVQPSLNAAFIDLGEERHGFLPVADVLESAYQQKPPKNVRRPSVDQVLKKGQPILVQVTKDSVGQKGAALTTNIALAGRYLVLTPFDSVRGISRKAEDDQDRKTIKSRLKKLSLPDDHGVIVRTNGIDQNQATLSRDLNALLRLWRKVQIESERGKGPRLLYSDQDLVVQALRDYLDPEIEQVVVDNDEVYEKAEDYMKAFMPRSKTRLVRYQDALPLFSRYRLETQIDKIYERTAALPSGGSIVIDHTEALTAIDVNSGRATRNANHEDSIFKINCEAAEEVARQLRLRDIGGLVVVDFIDMRLRKHQARLERIMRDAMKPDKARYSVGRVSPNGLLEINRQRIKQSLRLRTHRPCPTCNGQATIPTPEFSALRLLSRIEGRAASGRVKHVTVALHPELADLLQNHFRRELMGLESDHDVEVEIIATSTLRRTEERLEWVERSDEEAKALEKAQKREPAFSSSDLSAESRRRSRGSRSRDEGERPPKPSRAHAESEQPKAAKSARSAPRDSEDEQDAEPRKSSSRRRRSRSRRTDDQPSSGRPAAPQAADSARDTSDEAAEPTSSRRRRSRGGRRRRGGSRSNEGAGQEQPAAAQSKTTDDARSKARGRDDVKSDAKGDVAVGESTTPRRRRSRSRRRGTEATATGSAQPVEASPTAKDSSVVDDAKVVRRRRSSRRAGTETASDASEAAAKAERRPAKQAEPARKAGDSAGASETSARRTRSRASSRRTAAGSESRQGENVKAKVADDQPTSRRASAAKAENEPNQELTTRRRRSRSRGRGHQADAAEAPKTTDTAPEKTDTAPEKEVRSQRGGRGGGGNPPRAEGGSNGESRPERRAETNDQPTAPIGVLAGQGAAEAKPAKRRWAWWGGPANPAPDPNTGSGDS